MLTHYLLSSIVISLITSYHVPSVSFAMFNGVEGADGDGQLSQPNNAFTFELWVKDPISRDFVKNLRLDK